MNGESYGLQIWPVHSQGPSEQKPIKIVEKRERRHIQGLPAQRFNVPHVISGTGNANFVRTFIGSIGTNLKSVINFGKSSRGRIARDSRNFSGHPYIGRIALSSLR